MRLIRDLRKELVLAIPVTPEDDKVVLMSARSARIACGCVFLPKKADGFVFASFNQFLRLTPDIRLDTHPYGRHTTASDVLRAGCPVITFTGKAFASRAGKSLFYTLGFQQFVATDRESCLRIAVQLAQTHNS